MSYHYIYIYYSFVKVRCKRSAILLSLTADLPAHKRRILQWQEAVDSCPTVSRLHVLMAMLESCIKWEKSAENAVCILNCILVL